MIDLPSELCPNGMAPELLDYGSVQRGASAIRIDRPGSRWRIGFSFPPRTQPRLGKYVRGKRVGLRIPLPLVVNQGAPGAPVVDGAGQSGAALAVRGLTPGYAAAEDFWLTVRDASGAGYLHQVAATVVAGVDGKALIQIEPPLRAPFGDANTVELAAPTIEGFVDGDSWGWDVPLHRAIAVSVTVEEFA